MKHSFALVATLALSLTACGASSSGEDTAKTANNQAAPTTQTTQPESKPAEAPQQDIVDIAVGAGSFKTLVAAVKAAGLVDALKGQGPFTVFAPTDEAFAKLPAGTVDKLLQDKEALTKILKYHVVSGKVMSTDVVKLQTATTLAGAEIEVDASSGVKINNATVVKADIEASNGVIHVIDTVLIPQ